MLPIYQSGQTYQTAKTMFNDNSHSGLWFDKFYNYLIYKENGHYVDLDDANDLLCDEKDSDKKRLLSEFERDENKPAEHKDNKIVNYAHKKSKKDFFEGFKDGRGTTYCGNPNQLQDYTKRLANLCHAQQGKTAIYQNDWLMAIGLGNSHPLENGLLWHPTLGVPYFQGSTVKGLAKALMEKWGAEPELIKRWFGSVNSPLLKNELGELADEQCIGDFIFLDAVPVAPVMLKQSIMTPHYGDWYQQGDSNPTNKSTQPGDWHSPVPVSFLAVENAKMQFGVMPRLGANVSDDEIEQINNVIRMALEHLGIGAKTATGYGRMRIDEQAQKAQETKKAEQAKAQALEQEMAGLSENQKLIVKFKTALDNMGNSWHNKANQPPKIKVDNNAYDFLDLFKLVETWADDEQKYALETLFLPYLPKLLGKSISQTKWKERINPLKAKLGVK